MTTSSTIEINVDSWLQAVTFSANGEHLVSGERGGVRLRGVGDGREMASMAVRGTVVSVAVSKDGRRIAAVTVHGDVFVWDAQTFEQVWSHERGSDGAIFGVDFSPDSTQLVAPSEDECTASVWDIATGQRVLLLPHDREVKAAKYSPHGYRIATATIGNVQVYDSDDGRLIAFIPVGVKPYYNAGLLWSNDWRLLVVSDNTIMELNPSTGSTVSQWPVPESNTSSCIAYPRHGEFVVYSTTRTVTIWDISAHTQLGLIQYPMAIRSISVSPDGQFLAIAGEDGKIFIESLSRIIVRIEPEVRIDDAALESWKHSQLVTAEALLTAAIPTPQNPSHYALASRALVRARLQQWDAAIEDATESIKISPSVIGYIARSVALVGKGEMRKAYRACDIAFQRSHSTHVPFLLLVKAYMHLLLGDSRMEIGDYEGAIRSFERARAQTRYQTSRALLVVSLISGWKFDNLDTTVRRRLCEALYTAGCTREAGESVLDLVNTVDKEVHMTEPIITWVLDFVQRCLSTSESSEDTTLHLVSPTPLLRKWAELKLTAGLWNDALIAAVNVSSSTFTASRPTIYQALCDYLEITNRIMDAIKCFNQMKGELAGETTVHDEWAKGKLEDLGDLAWSTLKHEEAISWYSAALSLNPVVPQDLFMKRSKVYMAMDLWENALDDANQVISLDPSSPCGYDRKHAALHRAGCHDAAIETFETMLLKLSQLPDPEAHRRRHEYVHPEQTKSAIRAAIENALRHFPLVLINTESGRLLDRSEQACSFESRPIFRELISSMTTHIDHARIEHEVAEYYRYATFSHKWEDNEPLFEQVVRIVVYELDESLTHDKLQMFCKIVRDSGFHWAWSDTCCINKADHFVLQEALVSMFKWYEGSAVTIVLLRGVRSPAKRGDLARSIWNTRAWTLQEYHASKVVRFYTEDWKPYPNHDIPNHKESPEIIAEMEEATGVSARALMTLRPGLDDIRAKLRLASARHTTRIEDAAYSLLGIFSMSLPAVYGEGDKALGRLLAQLLTSSGDTSILAWTGRSGRFNSCLPATIIVFNQPLTTHIPPDLKRSDTDKIIARLRSSSLHSATLLELYGRLRALPVPSFAGQRMKLPCLSFKLGPLSVSWSRLGVFRAQTVVGSVDITTQEDLSRSGPLYLVHPWIDFLLDRQPIGSEAEMQPEDSTADHASLIGDPELPPFTSPSNITSAALPKRMARRFPHTLLPQSPSYTESLRPPSSLSPKEYEMRALQVIARLRQPFGALLLTPHSSNVAAYRRVAAESLITVQADEVTPTLLKKLVESVCILDVL
ncbi:hypothetical protein EV363DRAFT_1150633 [Boletus edulis]|nr:hypothetical protein EV363DRAFT_1150633 [Boletus edulis]